MPKVLIIRTDHLGDLILTTPLMRAFHKANYQVDVIAQSSNLPILLNNPYVSAYYSIESIAPEFPKKWLLLSKWIASHGYDILILPHSKPKELLFASLFSNVKKRIVMTGGIWGRITLHRCLRSGLLRIPRHMADVLLDIARNLKVNPDGIAPDIFLSNDEKDWAREQITKRFNGNCIVGIHPGCLGNTCNLPATVYGDVADIILKKADWGIIVTGSIEEKELMQNWPAQVTQSKRCWLTQGSFTLRQLSAVIAELNILLCPGTGPLHIASAMRTATVSPMCPVPYRSHKVWGNMGGKAIVIEGNTNFCKEHEKGYAHNCNFHGQITSTKIFTELDGLTRRLSHMSFGDGHA
ncbi:MAG: glycosyltransferase family 9 protein [Syntrophales bacterium]